MTDKSIEAGCPVPERLMDEFFGYMDFANYDELPDGAWFAMLEDQGVIFAEMHGLNADGNDLAHLYLAEKERRQAAK